MNDEPMTTSNDMPGIETYPVGLLADLKQHRHRRGAAYLRRQIEARNWRAVRNYFNGYLAEWHYPPEGMNHLRCGKGWTRAAARRSLGRRIVKANLTQEEANR